MAAPTVRAASALATGTTSVTPTMPTVVAGDVILVVGECANGAPATPSTYSLLFSRDQLDEAGVDTTLAVYAKIAAGSDGDPTLTGGSMGNHGIFGIITVQDHGVSDVTTGIVVGTGSGDATAGTGKIASGITVTADSLIVACFGDSADGLTSVWSNAANANLTGITVRLDGNTNTGNGGGTFVFTGACAGTSTGDSTADLAASTRDGWNSVSLGIPPVASPLPLIIEGREPNAPPALPDSRLVTVPFQAISIVTGQAAGRARVRSAATAISIVTGQAAGRARVRSAATALRFSVITAQALGHARTRSTVSASFFTPAAETAVLWVNRAGVARR